MEEVLLPSLLIASGGILSVGSIMLTLLFLGSQNGFLKGLSYVGGYFGGYALIGTGELASGLSMAPGKNGSSASYSGYIYAALGALFLFFAVKKWRTDPGQKEEPPKFFATIDEMRPLKALFFGAMVSVLNFKNLAIFLSAVSEIAVGELNFVTGVAAMLLADLVFCSALFFPLLVYLAIPSRSAALLGGMKQMLEDHNRTITIVLLSLFGVIFLYRGFLTLGYL